MSLVTATVFYASSKMLFSVEMDEKEEGVGGGREYIIRKLVHTNRSEWRLHDVWWRRIVEPSRTTS